jgi:hypothetical protein
MLGEISGPNEDTKRDYLAFYHLVSAFCGRRRTFTLQIINMLTDKKVVIMGGTSGIGRGRTRRNGHHRIQQPNTHRRGAKDDKR